MPSVLITCEHASFALPPDVDLGLSPDILRAHVSYDRGAKEIAEVVAARLCAPLHLGAHSRLLVDLNRREHNPAVILAETYGMIVPGNIALDARERERRLSIHRSYRERARADALRLAELDGCLHVSMHSFDPALDPEARCFDAGVLFDPAREPETRIARTLAELLAASGLTVRLNEPYAGTPEGLTSWLREQIEPERYSGIEIEACQGWMDRDGSLVSFGETLANAIATVAT